MYTSKMIDNIELAKWIRKEILKGWPNTPLLNHDKSWCQVPTEDELSFWIQQFKTKDCCGHSEWSERFQSNIWIKDEED
jgi:hypothetical protein